MSGAHLNNIKDYEDLEGWHFCVFLFFKRSEFSKIKKDLTIYSIEMSLSGMLIIAPEIG